MNNKQNSFSKKERLTKSFEFRRIKNRKFIYFNQDPIKVYILKQNLDCSRLGIIIYKKAAKAFYRNKIKRWIREIFRTNKNNFPEKIDILFVIGRGEQIINLELLQKAFSIALQKYSC